MQPSPPHLWLCSLLGDGVSYSFGPSLLGHYSCVRLGLWRPVVLERKARVKRVSTCLVKAQLPWLVISFPMAGHSTLHSSHMIASFRATSRGRVLTLWAGMCKAYKWATFPSDTSSSATAEGGVPSAFLSAPHPYPTPTYQDLTILPMNEAISCPFPYLQRPPLLNQTLTHLDQKVLCLPLALPLLYLGLSAHLFSQFCSCFSQQPGSM